VIVLALIPTVLISVAVHQWESLFVQYEQICWFRSAFIHGFLSIPLLVFIGINILILFGITVYLCRFSIYQKTIQQSEQRILIAVKIWLGSCITLGIAWVVGPFLDMMIKDQNQKSAMVAQWIFALFIGLEGLWVLLVNIIFYYDQRIQTKARQINGNKGT
jgi:hypothetical protein